jgi:hypothetical protein
MLSYQPDEVLTYIYTKPNYIIMSDKRNHLAIICLIIFFGVLGLSLLKEEVSYIVSENVNGIIESRNVRTGNIDFSGTDAGTVIQNSINATIDGGIIFIKSGVYKITKQELVSTDNISVVGEGVDATILDFSAEGQILIDGRKNIAFKSLTFKSDINAGMDRIKFNNTDGILFDNIKTIGGGKDWTNFMVHFNTGNSNIVITNVEATGSIDTPFRFYKTNTGLFVNNYYAHDLVSCNCGDGMDLFGVRNANISNFRAINVPGNGLGIYGDAKNININNIVCENIGYGIENSHIGKGISIVRWDDKDPSDIRINNFHVVNSNGHGLQINTMASPSSNSVTSGTINNISINNFKSIGSWWSAFTFEGGNVNNVIVSNFVVAQTNVSMTDSPPIYFNAVCSNIEISDGVLIPPFEPFTIPSGVSFDNVMM